MTGTAWNEEHHKIPLGSSSSKNPQPFVAAPFQRTLLDIMCAEGMGYKRINCIKSSRIGWTFVLMGVMMYQLGRARRNVTYFAATEQDAKDITKDTIDPTFAICKPVADAIEQIQKKREHDTATFKNLNGKNLRIYGAGSGRAYRHYPCDTVILDELDEYPSEVGGSGEKSQGHAVTLASNRVLTSGRGGMIVAGTSYQ